MIPPLLVDKEIAHSGLSELKITSSMHERKGRDGRRSDGGRG